MNKKNKINIQIYTITTIFLILTIIMLATLTTFFDNKTYDKGYTQNGAYERMNETEIWMITENVQGYFANNNELEYFRGVEKEHLEEVKEKLILADFVSVILQTILGILIIVIILRELKNNTKSNKTVIKQLKKNIQKIIFITISIFALIGIFWNWFFIKFHEVLFSGQWMFTYNTLMMQLWGGNFFATIGIEILKKIGIALIVLILLTIVLKIKEKNKKSKTKIVKGGIKKPKKIENKN